MSKEEGFPLVEVSGTPFERGLQHGRAVPYEQAPGLSGREFEKLFTDTWIGKQDSGGFHQSLHSPRGGRLVHPSQELVQARRLGQGFAGPLEFHQRGAGSGSSVLRLSAQASTAS